MRRIRKLYLQNAAGERWALNGSRGIYSSALSGFGCALEPVFAGIGHGFFPVADDAYEPQNSLAFTLTFTQSPYETYHQLMNWIAAAGTVTVVYSPFGAQEFYRDVTVNFIEKGELTKTGWLESPCSFLCLAPWRLPAPTALSTRGGEIGQRKRYSYRYTEDLRYGTYRAGSLSVEIAPSGHVPAALELRYWGAANLPRISLVGKNTGKTYGVCAVSAELDATDCLVFSSRYEQSFIKKVTRDGVETDLLDVTELGSGLFFRMPIDEPCTLYVEAYEALTGYADVVVHYYYRSV